MSKLVYIAGPYTNPDPIENIHHTIQWAEDIYDWSDHNLVPVVPHCTMLWHLIVPHSDVDFWYEYDLEILRRCDALLRIDGASTGADNEVAKAIEWGIPVFHQWVDLCVWDHAGR